MTVLWWAAAVLVLSAAAVCVVWPFTRAGWSPLRRRTLQERILRQVLHRR